MSRLARVLAVILAVLAVAAPASAHKPSDAYLTLVDRGDRLDVRWDIAVRDLDFALDLDGDGDGKVTWTEIEARRGAILGYASPRLDVVRGVARCDLADATLALATHSDGPYVVIAAHASCGGARDVSVRYTLFHELDREHRGVLRLVSGAVETVAVLDGASPPGAFTLGEPLGFGHIVGRGIVHIWTGADHLLFLLALLLPAVLVRDGGAWKPRPALRDPLWDTARVVTAFTLAHSITLSLAALGVVSLPSRFVEPAIAASVALAAANNLHPVLREDRWLMAFVLGLLHGFGFSSTLSDLGLDRGALLPVLLGFNLGVEVGQLAVVAAFLPVAFRLRDTRAYRVAILRAGSAIILALAVAWFAERAFAIRLPLPLPR